MVVNLTPNAGLAKPSDGELAANWVRFTKLCEDNNLIIADLTDITTISYTPSLAAQTTAPSVGAGTRQGQYQDIDGFIMGNFVIKFVDPGVSSGNGFYAISLPVPADGSFHTIGNAFDTGTGSPSVIGEGFVLDISAASTSGTVALDLVTVGGVSYVRLLTEAFTSPAKTSRLFTNGMPYTLATGDAFCGSFFYKRL